MTEPKLLGFGLALMEGLLLQRTGVQKVFLHSERKFERQQALGLTVLFCCEGNLRFSSGEEGQIKRERKALIVIYKQCVQPGQVKMGKAKNELNLYEFLSSLLPCLKDFIWTS